MITAIIANISVLSTALIPAGFSKTRSSATRLISPGGIFPRRNSWPTTDGSPLRSARVQPRVFFAIGRICFLLCYYYYFFTVLVVHAVYVVAVAVSFRITVVIVVLMALQ